MVLQHRPLAFGERKGAGIEQLLGIMCKLPTWMWLILPRKKRQTQATLVSDQKSSWGGQGGWSTRADL